jgi:protein gp37
MGQAHYKNGFKLTLHRDSLDLPLKWKQPSTVFVNSMSDLFHEKIPFEFLQEVFQTMAEAHWHVFQVLTKRAQYLASVSHKLNWTQNIWMGVSVENEKYLNRIDHLRTVPSSIKFLSLEPLLGPLAKINLTSIDWVIVGGESGPKARPVKKEWVTEIRDQCVDADVKFFFKQWGGMNKKLAGRELEGRIWDEMPETAKGRQLSLV